MIICSTFAGEQSAINDPTHHISNPLSHTLILNLTWTSQDNIPPISLDYMVVSDPPPNSDNMMYWASNSLVKTSLSESDFGWGMDNDLNCGQTSTQGSQLILPFTGAHSFIKQVHILTRKIIGVSATWYGFHKPDMRSQSSATPPATYSVDDGDESPFDTVPLPDGTPTNATWLMQQLFRTQIYPYGNHTLKVAYKANNTTNRLTFCTLLVHNSTATNNTVPSSATPSLSVAPPPPSAQAHQHHNEHETMAGGIGGGVAALIVLTFMAFFLHRCHRRVRLAEDRYDNHDQVAQPFPVPTEQTTSYLGPHKARVSLQSVGNPFMQEAEITPPVSKWTRRATFSGGTRSIVVVASGAPEPEVSANNAETQSVATTVAPASAAQVPNQQQTHSRQSPLSLDAIHPIHPQNSQEIYGLGGGMRVTAGAGAETPIFMPPPSYTL